jgi:hypothetical protein
LLVDEVEEAGAGVLAALPEPVEGEEAVLDEEAAVSEEPFEAPSPALLAPPAALSAAVTAGAGSLVLELPLSPPPF